MSDVQTFRLDDEIIITITQKAKQHMLSWITKNKAKAVRFSVDTTGCSGLTYVTELASSKHDDDLEVSCITEFVVYVKKDSVMCLNNMVVDIEKKTLGQSGLVYKNPNESARCGCGESFSVRGKT